MSSTSLQDRHRIQVFALFVIALVAGSVLAGLAGRWNEAQARHILEQRSRQALALHRETIFGLLDKYRLMTVLVARRPDTAQAFRSFSADPENRNTQDLKNFAGRLAAMSGASQVRLALPDGRILAQSSLESVSNLFLDERLRVAALQDRLGRATILDPEGGNTYAFAASVREGGEIVGIVNVQVGLQVLENAWALSDDLIFVTDAAGRFIVGNQLAGLLNADHFGPYGARLEHVEAEVSGHRRAFLAAGAVFPHIGWALNVLIDEQPAISARNNAIIITALIGVIITALLFILLQRRLAILTRLEAERETAALLERTVARRTAELRGSNEKLRAEFDERVAAEAALKQAQDGLIQSAKLAAIGQMSTALAHEYNQPLAAIRSYADNARAFLRKGRAESADDNLVRITRMTERMAELSRTLKTFARKPRSRLQPVALKPLFEEAILLAGPAANKKRVRLHLEPMPADISVMAGHVRLSQVIINLLSNAIDAVQDQPVRDVFLGAGFDGDRVVIRVRDTGPGVPQEDSTRVFDAFFTSKDVGEGLGLGLSIAYNIVHDFGGEISVTPAEEGGAVFTIVLPARLDAGAAEEHAPGRRAKSGDAVK